MGASLRCTGGRTTPVVSVVMSVYNGERHVQEAVESILNQTLADFEFIIVDDGSTDATWQILTACAARDPRIVLLRNEENIGLTKSLNKGLALAGGKYIARQDADEVSSPNRLAYQTDLLDRSPSVALVGCSHHEVHEPTGRQSVFHVSDNELVTRWRLLFRTPFAHGTAMFRRDVATLLGSYDENLYVAQDYDLWSRIARQHRLSMIDRVLVRRLTNPASVSHNHEADQRRSAAAISSCNIRELCGNKGVDPSTAVELHHLGNARFGAMAASSVSQVIAGLETVYQSFAAQHDLESPANASTQRQIRHWMSGRVIGLAGFWGESGLRGLAFRILWDLMRAEAALLTNPAVYRAAARSLLGRYGTRWVRLLLRRPGTYC